MGKGDKKTLRGKLFSGSFGVSRPKKKKNAVVKASEKTIEKAPKVEKVQIKEKAPLVEKVQIKEKAPLVEKQTKKAATTTVKKPAVKKAAKPKKEDKQAKE